MEYFPIACRAPVLFAPFMENDQTIFRCPHDKQYFAQQGLSYEYPAGKAANKTRPEYLGGQPSEYVYILYDFERTAISQSENALDPYRHCPKGQPRRPPQQ